MFGAFGHSRSIMHHLLPLLRLRQIGPTRTQVTHHTNLSHDYSAVVRLTSSRGHSIVDCVGANRAAGYSAWRSLAELRLVWNAPAAIVLANAGILHGSLATSCMEC